jgi:hypothetical protein
MAALIENLAPRRQAGPISSFDDWIGLWGLDSLGMTLQTTMPRQEEVADGTFFGLVSSAYLRNSVVFACLAIRARLFGEARFQFQQLRGGRPGALFGTPDLNLLENPEPGKTTRDLLSTAILDADLGGHGVLLGRSDRIRRLRPDWVTIAYGSKGRATDLGSWDPDAEIIGFGYYPGGPTSGIPPETFLPEEIGHFTPTKDPLARNRGISLLTAGLREVLADSASTTHKLAFFQNAATPNLALKFPATMDRAKAQEWIELFEQEHRGASKAFRTIFLGAGVEPFPVGLNFVDMDYAKIQGRAETRIAMLTGMHPVVVALSEGLQGSSLNTGNFGQAARLVGDATLRPLWGDIAGSLQSIMPPPPGTRLWYDDRDIAFLREDVKDQAEITKNNAATIGQLVKDGFTSSSAIEAVVAGDMNRLVHTGLVSVQLQPPGATMPSQAQAVRVSVGELRDLLAAGFRPSTAIDEELVRHALLHDQGRRLNGAGRSATYRATRTFWPAQEPLARLGTIEEGQEIDDDLVVATYPSLFAPVPVPPQLSMRGGQIDVSAEQILTTRRALEAAGRPAGYASLARELKVGEMTIRRRLASTNH